MADTTILLVEDDTTLLQTIAYNLEKEGYSVATAQDGITALDMAGRLKPDLIILDIMLPGMSGFDVCRMVRKSLFTPIIMLTAKSDEIDKVLGLELGADDYVTKPFSMRELMARVRAQLRRSDMSAVVTDGKQSGNEILHVGGITLDPLRHEVVVDGQVVDLRPKEFELLQALMAAPGQVLTRSMLLEKIWGYEYLGDTRTVDVHIRWLREKIEPDPASPRYIHTVRNVGYKFEDHRA